MNKLLLFVALYFLMHSGLEAQKMDTSEIKVGNIKITIETDEDSKNLGREIESEISQIIHKRDRRRLNNVQTRVFLFELGLDGYLFNGSTQLPEEYRELQLDQWRSVNVNIHLFRQRINLVKHKLNLMYGLLFEFHDYTFRRSVTLQPKQDTVTPVELGIDPRKSKLQVTYFTLPILFNFETNPYHKKRSFRLNAGAFLSVRVQSHTKVKSGGSGGKVKIWDDFNLRDFRYGITSQIGFGWFNMYLNYTLSPMFKEGEGPDFNQFALGFVILGF